MSSQRHPPAPVALFVYNRPRHTRETLAALERNGLARTTDLFVFADGPKNSEVEEAVREVSDVVGGVRGFKSVTVVRRERNLGLANSIITGVSDVCERFGRVIVLEDDLVTAPFFLHYMNDALNLYGDDDGVGSIHGYWYSVEEPMPPTFFLRGASCWGWATWLRAWRLFEADGSKLLRELERQRLTRAFDLDGSIAYTRMLKDQIAGKNSSWAIRWHAATFLANRLQLSPGRSLVRNIGFDGTGTHLVESSAYAVDLAEQPVRLERTPIEESARARAALIRYHRATKRSLPTRVFGRLRRLARRGVSR